MILPIVVLASFVNSPTMGSGLPDDPCPALIAGREWEPIRIKVLMGATDKIDAGQSAILTSGLLPRAVAFWQKSMRIRRTWSPVRLVRTCLRMVGEICVDWQTKETCGHTVVPDELLGHPFASHPSGLPFEYNPGPGEARADFVVFVTATSAFPGWEHFLAYANTCAMDECGRPIMGHVNINPNFFTERNADGQISTLIHEIAHALGFMADFAQWRLPDGSRRNLNPRTVAYSVITDEAGGLVRALFGRFSSSRENVHLSNYTFPTGVVESLAIRGFGAGSTCRCPIDPNKRYTDDDLTDCLTNPGNCAFAITTPRVKAAAREFFDCDTLNGMELENQVRDLRNILNPHWKTRLVGGEIMNSDIPLKAPYVSPMTFAFFEDSGWYQMDYSMTSTPVRGATWGYKQGCAFVKDKCVSDATGEVQRPPMFPNSFCGIAGPHCSADAKGTAGCWRAAGPSPSASLRQYEYRGGLGSSNSLYDFCPVFPSLGADHPLLRSAPGWLSSSTRCLMEGIKYPWGEMGSTLVPTSTTVKCLGGHPQSYEVSTDERLRGVCVEQGQVLAYPDIFSRNTKALICSSPALICAQFRYPHLPAFSPANQQIDGVDSPDLPLDSISLLLNIAPIPSAAPPGGTDLPQSTTLPLSASTPLLG